MLTLARPLSICFFRCHDEQLVGLAFVTAVRSYHGLDGQWLRTTTPERKADESRPGPSLLVPNALTSYPERTSLVPLISNATQLHIDGTQTWFLSINSDGYGLRYSCECSHSGPFERRMW